MHLEEKTLSSDVEFEGKIFTITHDIVELENGSTAVRDVLLHHGGVCVIPVTENNEIYMVKQYRYPFRRVTLEVPAGKLEKGEDHAECGRRELLEETGCVCSEYIYLGEMYPTPAYNTEVTYMYLAKGLEIRKQDLDEDEFLDVVTLPISKAVDMVMKDEIKDGKTQIAILKAARLLGI
ncbi:MAG TPA: NUDIX hydrolase [Ruminococcus sp.]|nr:NUDIX hydrolase [Ruminococcus sp.]